MAKTTSMFELGSAESMGFYKWSERDFITVPAYELEVGDEIALGNGPTSKYGTIALKGVAVIPGNYVQVQYTLPVGAKAQSAVDVGITVMWEGKKPLIQVVQDIDYYKRVLIRK
jgi:hypothetical protein